jgi:hypothetical protein
MVAARMQEELGWTRSSLRKCIQPLEWSASEFKVAPPQHPLSFLPEPHEHGSFRPTSGAICQGVGALLLRTMASPSYGDAGMLATDHTGSACRSIVRG